MLFDLEGQRYDLKRVVGNSLFVLLVFFSPLDCAPCLEEKYLWQKIYDEGIIKLVGIGRHIDARELRNWVDNSGLSFPVLYDADYEVTKSFRIKRTPFKILLKSERKILLVDNARASVIEQEEFVSKLYAAMQH